MKPKILYLSPSTIPSNTANSVHVMKMCSAMADAGYDVHLFSYSLQAVKSSEIFDYYGVKNNFRIIGYKNIKRLNKIKKIITILYYLFTIRPRYIYCRYIEMGIIAAYFNKRVIFEFHDLPEDREKRRMKNIIERRRYCLIVAISEVLKIKLVEIFKNSIEPSKITIAHDAVDLERFTSCKHESDKTCRENQIIGYVGSLYPGRGIEIILQLAERMSSCEFLIVGGDKNQVEANEKLCLSRKIKNCKFIGHVSNSLLPVYYNKMDVLLMPYQPVVTVSGGKGNTVEWMSPLKMFEYMASKKPIICSELNVLKEVLSNEENALLVSPTNVEEWETAITRLLGDAVLYRKLTERAFRDVKNYTWEKRVNNILKMESR